MSETKLEVGIDVYDADLEPVNSNEQNDKLLASALRKVDKRLLPPLALLYLFSYLDRGSLANASIFGYKADVGITTTQYNLIATVFYFTYAGFEIPANIVMCYVRPNLWIFCLCITWGTVLTLSGLVHNYGGAMAARLCLGIAEAGFFPAALVLVGNWYPRKQLQSRIAGFYSLGVFSGAFSGLLAYAISYMDDVGGLASWRWIFILEGIATVLLAFPMYFAIPNSPETSKFLTEEEKEVIIAMRSAEGTPGKHFEMKYLVEVLKDGKVWLNTWLGVATSIVAFGFIYTLPTILVQLGYTTTNAQLMTIPIYVVACIFAFGGGLISDRTGLRFPVIVVGLVISLVGVVMLYCLPKTSLAGVRYFGCILTLAGLYGAYPGMLTWCSNNANSAGKRNMAVAFMLTLSNVSSAAGTNAFLAREAPTYKTGFGLCIAMNVSAICATILLVYLCRRGNRNKGPDEFHYVY